MSITNVLVVFAGHELGGDIKTMLLGLHDLDPAKFNIYAVSPPSGLVFEYLDNLPNVRLYTMEMGGGEAPEGSPSNRFRRLQILAVILRIAPLVKRAHIDVIYTVNRTVGMHISYALAISPQPY